VGFEVVGCILNGVIHISYVLAVPGLHQVQAGEATANRLVGFAKLLVARLYGKQVEVR